ncbi:siderophore-interacting protein [Naumannella halotolerans]|uniref:NADPH-dependent ferric siderophore reductase n=1 Tax=Naumannella halotolerans TaxID=993414 RepID=A0A4R7J2R3_9ACTN|nr:siderophore-interacting protein [Naumannella halotolerans]TDT31315.1 NADPH-dependent ferric siderophore reductase [Naumannella halotolerans]
MSEINLVHRCIVQRATRLSPSFLRIVLGGEGLDGFVTSGVGDEYLRIFFPEPGSTEPVLPAPSGDRGWEYPDGVTPSPMRTYTVRAWDETRRELTIDFVVHDGGIAATWALRAKPGDVVGVNTPHPLYDAPEGIGWQLLVADATGLPAAARLVELAPPGVRTRVVLEVSDEADRVAIDVPAGIDLHLVLGGNGHGPSQLGAIVEAAALPDGPGYIWVAGEAKTTRAVRKLLRHEKALPNGAYKVMGYWTENAEQWRDRYESLPAATKQHLLDMWSDESRDADEIEDDYIAELERLGL